MRLGLATALVLMVSFAAAARADEFVVNGTFAPADNSAGDPAGYGAIPAWIELGATIGSTNFNTADLWNNGTIPTGTTVGFIQENGSLSQPLNGLTPGTTYTLTFVDNSRDLTGDNCCNATPTLTVSVGGSTLTSGTVTSVGDSNPFHFITESFVATAGSELLLFSSTTPGGNDGTLLLSDVSVSTAVGPVPEPSSLMLLGTGILGAAGMMRRRFLHS